MMLTYQDTPDPLAHRDASFINVIYYMPLKDLLQMDKEHIHSSLIKARLVCRWLEGILTRLNHKGE